MKKKCLCLILSVLLTITSVTPVWADSQVTVTDGVPCTLESIDTTDRDTGADVNASAGGEATLIVNDDVNVSFPENPGEESKAVSVSASNNSRATVTIGGDAIVQAADNVASTGIEINTADNSSANVRVTGISSQSEEGYACGVAVATDGRSSAEVSVGTDGITAIGDAAEGIHANAVGGSVNINVAGDITTNGTDPTGAYISVSDAASANLDVKGDILIDNIESSSNPKALNLQASGSNTTLTARVCGDINGDQTSALPIEIAAVSGARVNVVAEGTLTAGSESAIAFAGDPDNISLTIWKAEVETGKSIVKESVAYEGATTYESNSNSQALERSIHYIIKVDTSQEIALGNVSVQRYTTPDGQVISYDTAKENEQVAVRLTIPDGYELKGVFSDKDRTTSLEKDNDGNYYLIVPKGGGVYVNMWLVEKADSDNIDDPQPADPEAPSATDQEAPSAGEQQTIITSELDLNNNSVIINFPSNGEGSLDLDYATIQSYISQGLKSFSIRTHIGNIIIPFSDLKDYIKEGNKITFVLNGNNLLILVNGVIIKTYSLAKNESTINTLQQQFEAFKQAQERNNSVLSNAKTALSNQLANTQKSLSDAVTARDTYKDKYKNATKGPSRPETPPRAAQLSKNNAVGNGYGGYVAQGGHVQINGRKSNVTFTLAAPTSGVLNSASKQADSVGGTLLHCVTTSSPGVSFKSATVNFTVTGVTANDTIAVYQLQGKTWVQVLVSSITENHVTVNLTQHGPLAFVRVAAVSTATH